MNLQSVRSSALLVALVIGAAVFPSSLTAQQDSAGVVLVAPPPAVVAAFPVVKVTPASDAGPRIVPASITNPRAADHLLPRRQDSMGNGNNIAMMVVGGAGIVVGSLVGGDGGYIIAVTGGVIGLVGLFRYLR